MFEDATFHSAGIQPSQTPKWMLLTLALNLTLLSTTIVLPLMYPDGLPARLMQRVLYAPPAQEAALPQAHPAQPVAAHIQSLYNPLLAPRVTPTTTPARADANAPNGIGIDIDTGDPEGVIGSNGPARLFQSNPPPVVRSAPREILKLSTGVIDGMIVSKTAPLYPPIPKAMGISGTVVLDATISKSGTIENLRVVSGNQTLCRAAIEAVQTWRYRPYLLNNQPVEVETTINVVFSLGNR